ncbi:DegT/DnrJ/EryC1/StrS family aminotransferase [Pseudofulvibacter geojedonensis]|uniref:DegT/DnrJ/EryC1/StrS family aminotransferase n=1 Tax=Pseudofulvibacter geojedonensis TaxID=1123758 RepID=A0ABW3I4Y8_9FLAO
MKSRVLLSNSHLSGKEKIYIQEAIESNELTYGNNLNVFQDSLESYLGNDKKIVALSSGTSAIHLALIMAGVKHGDEVICQSFTFSASANPITYQGAIPVFVDSEKDTWNMCPIHLEKAIKHRISLGKKPKAIILVHLYGMPAKIDEVLALAKKYEIALIEDAAEALGSSYKGQKCGTFGDFGILSFNGNKIITTSGGGALVCKNDEDKKKAIFLATQARDEAVHYEHSHIGYNYRMSNIVAGIGRGQMEVLDKHVALRQEMNNFYRNLFKEVKGVQVLQELKKGIISNHWLSCVVINEQETGFSREDLRLALLKDNIESRPLWKPMHLQPIFVDSAFYGDGFSEELFKKGLCLPSGSNLTEVEKDRVKVVIKKMIG